MSFIKNGNKTEIYRISCCNKLDGMYGGQLSQYNSLASFNDDAENCLLNFLMYMQIASTDIYMATQNCIQNYSKFFKLKVPTKSKARSWKVVN